MEVGAGGGHGTGGFALLGSPKFAPVYWTQFLGAFNDNLFKNAMVMGITFGGIRVFGLPPEQVVAMSGAVFILPFFLFSALSGQLSDRYDKASIMRWVKAAEIAIMLVGLAGFASGHYELLMIVLFAMGIHSTVFGPCKYSILPQLLEPAELVTGNALVEQGTYLAILAGTIAGGVLVNMPGGAWIVGVGTVVTAGVGLLAAQRIPSAPPSAQVALRWEPVGPTIEILKLTAKVRSVWLSVLGISWFWLFGATFLALFPVYTKDVLHGNETIATLFLALFSVGIGLGSMLCERLSRHRLELGIVPIGALGLTLFTGDLGILGEPWPAGPEPIGMLELLSRPAGWRMAFDLVMLSMSGGLMIVPLYTMIQWRTAPAERSRVIAGNNIVNAGFMVAGALGLMQLQARGFTAPQVFLLLALGNAMVAAYMYTVVPEFVLRFFAFILSNVMYRVNVRGLHHVPVDGPCVLVCNHVSFVDWLILAGAVKRPPRFVMDRDIASTPVLRWLFDHARCIPIASRKVDPALVDRAMELVSEELRNEGVVCIFPEGRLTSDGEVAEFRRGIEEIVARDPVPVIPMGLDGLWGSFFSRKDGQALRKPFRRWWSQVSLTIGEPVPPEQVTADGLRTKVLALLNERQPG